MFSPIRPSSLILFFSLFLIQSCYYDNELTLYHINPASTDCSKVSSKFTANVQPIINTFCAIPSCHNSTGSGGVILTSYALVQQKLSRIQQRVLVDKTMPPNGALTTLDLQIIQCWISQGGLNN